MKTTRFMNRMMVGSLLLVAGIVASCGEIGNGTSGLILDTNCSEVTRNFVPGESVLAGYVMSRFVVVATKDAGLQRTKFGNDTIIDSTPTPTNIPAAHTAVYVTTPMFYRGNTPVLASSDQFPLFTAGPTNGTQETLPTVFFTDDRGRLELEVQWAQTVTFPIEWHYDTSVSVQTADGSQTADCTYTIEISAP